jgi:hypothetical protein
LDAIDFVEHLLLMQPKAGIRVEEVECHLTNDDQALPDLLQLAISECASVGELLHPGLVAALSPACQESHTPADYGGDCG